VWTFNACRFSAESFLLLKESRIASDFKWSMGEYFVYGAR
jgi:hypothetical protein